MSESDPVPSVADQSEQGDKVPDKVTEETQEDASPGPNKVAEVTEESSPGPDNVTAGIQEASPKPDIVTEGTPKASPGPDNAKEETQEASPGPDNAKEETPEASPGPDNAKEETQEASPGPNNAKEEKPEASPGPDNVTKGAEKVEESSSEDVSQNGGTKVVIITGANTGIGLIAAELLAKDGYEVIMACRSAEKAEKAVAQVQKTVPGAKVSFMKLDLNSLKSVREFSDAFHATGKPLHVLCNNAGLTTGFSSKERLETEEGFEMTFGVNHLGHFLLTNLLLDVMKKTADACGEVRIVNTSSGLHDPESPGGRRGTPAHLDFDNLMMDKPDSFDGQVAYKNSKLANCAFSVELAKRLERSKVTSNTLCPGFIPATGLGRNETTMAKIGLTIFTPLLKLMGVTRTVEHGGGMIHYVATSPEFKDVTGRHASDFKMIDSSKESRDPDVGKKLWDISADLVKYETAKAL